MGCLNKREDREDEMNWQEAVIMANLYNTLLYQNYKYNSETGEYDIVNSVNKEYIFSMDAAWIDENESVDPVFKNITNITGVDGEWFTADDGLILNETDTECKDAGNNSKVTETYDITGKDRIDDENNIVDIGAYETQ